VHPIVEAVGAAAVVATTAGESLSPTVGLAVFLPGLDGFVQAHGMGEKDGVPVAALASRWAKMVMVKENISQRRKLRMVDLRFANHMLHMMPDRNGMMTIAALIQKGVVIEGDPHLERGDSRCGRGGDYRLTC